MGNCAWYLAGTIWQRIRSYSLLGKKNKTKSRFLRRWRHGHIGDLFTDMFLNKMFCVILLTPLECVFILSFSPVSVLCLFSAARHAHPSCRSETTAEAWESVDTFLGESEALNFQRNVWTDLWNWTSSGQLFIRVLLYKFPCVSGSWDCVTATSLLLAWVTPGSPMPLPPVTVKVPWPT